jgi:hypothetical protein
VNSAMHSEAVIEQVWKCTEAETEQTQRCTRMLESNNLGDGLQTETG